MSHFYEAGRQSGAAFTVFSSIFPVFIHVQYSIWEPIIDTWWTNILHAFPCEFTLQITPSSNHRLLFDDQTEDTCDGLQDVTPATWVTAHNAISYIVLLIQLHFFLYFDATSRYTAFQPLRTLKYIN